MNAFFILQEVSSSSHLMDPRTSILGRFEKEGWLSKDDNNRWIIGVRTFLELKGYIENAIMDSLV